MPPRRKARMVGLASGRIRSSSTSAPAGSPSTATNTVSAPSSWARLRAVLTHGGVAGHAGPGGAPGPPGGPRRARRCPGRATSSTVLGQDQRAVPLGRRADDGARPGRARTPGRASRQGQDLLRRQRCLRARRRSGRAGRPVSVPVLSMISGGAPGQAFQHAAALDHHAAPGRRRQAPRPGRPGPPGSAGTGWLPPGRPPPGPAPPSAQAIAATARVSGRNHMAYRSASRTNGACERSASATSRTMPA